MKTKILWIIGIIGCLVLAHYLIIKPIFLDKEEPPEAIQMQVDEKLLEAKTWKAQYDSVIQMVAKRDQLILENEKSHIKEIAKLKEQLRQMPEEKLSDLGEATFRERNPNTAFSGRYIKVRWEIPVDYFILYEDYKFKQSQIDSINKTVDNLYLALGHRDNEVLSLLDAKDNLGKLGDKYKNSSLLWKHTAISAGIAIPCAFVWHDEPEYVLFAGGGTFIFLRGQHYIKKIIRWVFRYKK